MKSLIRSGVETVITVVICALPVAWIATWFGVPPTWLSAAFAAFCIFWSGFVFAAKVEEATRDARPAADIARRAVPPLTRSKRASQARAAPRRLKLDLR